MSVEQQQDFLAFFAPAAGVHHTPPSKPGIIPSAPVASTGGGVAGIPSLPPDDIVFERSYRARNYRLTLRRDGTAVATIPARGSEREARR